MSAVSPGKSESSRLLPACITASTLLLLAGCAVSVGGSGGGIGGGAGGGTSIPMPGGSSGGGMPGGSSGGGMPGGSAGGGMPGGASGGGMPGGASGGGMAGGGAAGGGMAGGGGNVGIKGLGGSMPGGGMPGGTAGGMPGGTAPDGTPCGTSDLPGGVGGMEQPTNCDGAGGVGQFPGETAAQRKARLEGELEESVGGFDEVLAEEQREISTVGRNTEGFGGGATGGGGRVGLGRQEAMRGTSQGDPSEGVGGGGSTPSIAGMSDDEINSRTPDDIPTLVSEDIVAKQLREAALAEEDPELRERLWEEYRRYNKL